MREDWGKLWEMRGVGLEMWRFIESGSGLGDRKNLE